MLRHLESLEWADRGLEYAGTPLNFSHIVLQVLVELGELALAEDLAKEFFEREVQWDNKRQKTRTENWLAGLAEPAATVIVRAMRAGRALDYHRQMETWETRSRTVHAALALDRLS